MLEPVEESEAPDPQSAPRTPPKSKIKTMMKMKAMKNLMRRRRRKSAAHPRGARNIFALVASGLSLVIGTGTENKIWISKLNLGTLLRRT